jgi:hypothetical protein
MTEAALAKALEIKRRIGNCRTFSDDLMRMRTHSNDAKIKVETPDDSGEFEPSIYFMNDLIGIMGNEIDRLQKDFNDLK